MRYTAIIKDSIVKPVTMDKKEMKKPPPPPEPISVASPRG